MKKLFSKLLLFCGSALATVVVFAGLETPTYISDLVSTNPLSSDPASQGDDHIRNLKLAIKNTFPNINNAVTLTDENFNDAALKAAANTFTATNSFTSNGSNLRLNGNDARMLINETDGAVDEKNWLIRSVGSCFDISTANDAAPFSAINVALNICRTGTAVGAVSIPGQTTFSSGGNAGALIASGTRGIVGLFEDDVAADNGRYRISADGESLKFELLNDAASSSATFMQVDRTANTRDSIALTSTALTWNGNTLFTTANDGAASGLDADLLDGQSSAFYQSAANLNAGTLADARVAQSNVTQHQAALTILESQITDSTLLTRNAGTETITGNWTYSTGTPAFNAGTSGVSAPFTVDSTFLVTNLNSQFLNGQTSTFYQDAGNLNAGTLPNARFPATLPAVSGVNLTSLNMANAGSGTLAVARGGTGTTTSTGTGNVVLSASPTLSGTITGGTFAGTHTGDGSGLTGLDASDISAGTLAIARGGTGQTDGTARNITGKAGVAKTLSTSAPSGGSDGDIWYRY